MAHATPTKVPLGLAPSTDSNKSSIASTSHTTSDLLLDIDGHLFEAGPEPHGATGYSRDRTMVKKKPGPSATDDDFSSSPPMPPKMSLIEHDYTVKKRPLSQAPMLPKKRYHDWNPPMLGTLPDDFLRVVLAPHQMPPPPPQVESAEMKPSVSSSPVHTHTRSPHMMTSPAHQPPSWSPSRSRSSTQRSEGARSRTSGSRSLSAAVSILYSYFKILYFSSHP